MPLALLELATGRTRSLEGTGVGTAVVRSVPPHRATPFNTHQCSFRGAQNLPELSSGTSQRAARKALHLGISRQQFYPLGTLL